MKKTSSSRFFLLALVLLMTLSINLLAQEAPSAGPVPFVNSKVDYATNNGIDLLAGTAYAHSTNTNTFVSLPVPGGTPLTTIGAMTYGSFASSGTFGAGGVFYLTTVTSGLFTVNLTTGVGTLVAPLSVSNLNGISYDPVSGNYYAVDATNLYTVNVATGTVTLVGSMGITGSLFIDIAINCAGEAYSYNLADDNGYRINLATGAATLLGPLGFNANFGQGMAFDKQDGTLYLMAFDNTAFTMQLRTMNLTTGATTLVFDYGLNQIAPFDVNNTCGPPVGPGPATNPSPGSGATGVSASLPQLTWQNPAGATGNQTFFGTSPGSLNMVQSGTLATSYNIPMGTLNYSTTYYWRIDEIDGSGTTTGPTWSFTIESDPNIQAIFFDDFEASTDTVPVNFTVINDGGTLVWRVFGSPYPNAYTMPATSSGKVFSADADEGGSGTGPTTLLSTAVLTTPLNCSNYSNISLQFDSDWNAIDAADSCYVDVSNNGTTWVNYLSYGGVDVRNTTVTLDISATADGQSTVWIRFKSVQPGWDWWWTIDNVLVEGVIPVELSAFTALANGNNVVLNWSTATETNNHGFEVQRKVGSEFVAVGYVEGAGTTTETQNYTYTDREVGTGTHTYRLKQIDLDGTFEYTQEVEAEIISPSVFALEQNYPNPFNPSTKISYSLAIDSRVTLKIFDVLGQEVMTLINSSITSGLHEVNFNASNLNSGVYFYTIDAQGVDGSNFTSTKKMILTK
ncbi:MAG: T9SS type A sorting domain-containing protein [Ignavibacteriales bacterium]|nr:MAG: T9SS type A sorting domain-containing protein [Ignavibacteriales bacterium]